MIRSLRTGVSGLKSHQVRMDVISNNIANVNTTAFKRGRAAFNELLGQTLLGVGRTAGGRGINPAYVGLGVSVGSIDVNFAQGALENTGVATDLGINGDGFFVVRGGDRIYLTRAGNFTINRFGELVTNSGLQVQGWAFDENGELQSAALEDVRVPFSATAPPKQTENIYVRGNLNAEASTQDPVSLTISSDDPFYPTFTFQVERNDIYEWTGSIIDENGQVIATDIQITFDEDWNISSMSSSDSGVTITEIPASDPDDPSTFQLTVNNYDPDGSGSIAPFPISFTFEPLSSSSPANPIGLELQEIGEKVTISTVVYDAQGKDSSVILEFTRINSLENGDPQDEWALRILDRGGQPLHTGYLAKLIYDTQGTLTEIRAVDGSLIDDLSGDGELTLPVSLDFNGDGLDETFTLNLAGADDALTQYAGSTTATVRDQDGRPPGSLIGFSINQEGIVELNFSNGYQQKIYQLALGSVNNVNGLQQVGDNLWSLTSSSGDLALGRAGVELNRTVIVAGTLEMSNVDLATEFTDMIVTQRGYQASARIITTSDEMLQELVQLKR